MPEYDGRYADRGGQTLLTLAHRVEETAREFEAGILDVGKRLRRKVTILASEGVSTYLLSPLLYGPEYGPLGGAARRPGIELPPVQLVAPHAPGPCDIRIA
ncbi:hypothetical protein [Azospirillum halopraeferens]|uniref:hypothetical protein n=1 Tax=Azospirillum halopraeferens TaxID=34010 RepID=UPI00048A76D9|nr:hypothetical protein [Azospirillum halopraeferens]